MNREEMLNRVKMREKDWDFIIIGGGATGVGCAVDAASRGFDVLLLEQNDFGKGTSSRSTKLIHGGVRYLAQGNIRLVFEALKERGILLENAPHLIKKQAFIVPCYNFWQNLQTAKKTEARITHIKPRSKTLKNTEICPCRTSFATRRPNY